MIFNAISKRLRTVTVDIFQSEGYVSGENVKLFLTGVSKKLAIFPITFKDLKFLPEGQFSTQDIKAYEIGDPSIPLKSIIIFSEEKYLVKMQEDREYDGNFSRYIGKKIDDSSSQD